MQIRGYFSNRVWLDSTLPGSDGPQFARGEIVRGLVESVKGNGLVQLQLKGMSIEARSEVHVQPGQQLYLYVDDFREGRTYLRIVSAELLASIENDNLATGLARIGVKAGNDTLEAARKLVQYNLPVTRENINHLLRNAALLGGPSPANLEVAVFALARGVTATGRLLEAIKSFLGPPRNVAALMEEGLQLLKDNGPVGEVRGPSITASGDLEGKRVFSAGAKLPGADAQGSGLFLAAAGPEALLSSGTEPGAGERGPSQELVSSLPGPEEVVLFQARRPLPLLESLLKTLAEFQSVQSEEQPHLIAARLREIIGGDREVIRALVLARELLENSPELARHPVIKEVLARIEVAEREVGGQRVFNAVDGRHDNSVPCYYFAIPLKVDGENRLCQLKVFKDTGDREGPYTEGEFRLAIALETARLGSVLFHVTCRPGRVLHLQGVAEQVRARAFLEKNLLGLIEALQRLGYEVTNGGIRLAGEKEAVLKPGLAEDRGRYRLLGIDIRV